MRSTPRSLALSLLLLAGVSACSNSAQQESAADAPTAEADVAPAEGGAARMPAAAPAPGATATNAVEEDTSATVEQVASSAAVYTDAQRKFIRTAQAEFRVDDVYKSALSIEDVVAAQGGFVVKNDIAAETQSTQRRPMGNGRLVELVEYTVRGRLTVRVPSANTQAFLRAIVGQMAFLERRNFEAMDAQFELLRQQLAYQRSQEAQQELGQATQQGGRIDRQADVIQARSGARSSRDEALIAQKEFEDRVAFATIDLSLYQASKIRKTELTDVEAVFQQNSPGFFARLGNSLSVGWYGVLDVLIALIKLWPLWIVVIGVLWIYGRVRRKRNKA
jgi:Domain of unknown function (DUF4349)